MKINKEDECEVVKKQLSKNQKDWVEHFNNKGEKMISAPDIYKTAKNGTKELIESLRQNFDDGYIVTSTRIIYNKENLKAYIIQDADSTIVKPKKVKVNIPYFTGDFNKDNETEKYLKVLFDTKDDIDNILKTLKRFDKKRKIRLCTPSQSSRESNVGRAVSLCFYGFDRFSVGGIIWFDYFDGFSHGVTINPAKQGKKTRGKSK